MLKLKEYYEKAKTFAVYPKDKSKQYLDLGLLGEVGEVCDKIKKVIRDTNCDFGKPDTWPEDVKHHIVLELGDVCWYTIIRAGVYIGVDSVFDSLHVFEEIGGANRDMYDLSLYMILTAISISSLELDDIKIFTNTENMLLLISVISKKLGYNLQYILDQNIAKLTSRQQRDKLKGSGDDR